MFYAAALRSGGSGGHMACRKVLSALEVHSKDRQRHHTGGDKGGAAPQEENKEVFLVQQESNTYRISATLFVPFGLVVLDLRQQACVLRDQNHPNIASRNVLCSFFGADFRPDEALAAGNTWRILKANNEVWAYIRPIKTDAGSIPLGPSQA